MGEVRADAARVEERDVIANLIQLYTHDFSELWAGSPLGELENDGRFADYPLDVYWQSANQDVGELDLVAAASNGRPLNRGDLLRDSYAPLRFFPAATWQNPSRSTASRIATP